MEGKIGEKRQHVSHASINLIESLRYNLSIMPTMLKHRYLSS
jgi:hypothetical protein